MEIEREKVLNALARISNLNHTYEVIVSGIGRESTAKAMMQMPPHDICVLMGFAAVVGKEAHLPDYLHLGKPIITEKPKLNLPCLSSLTSDKFVRTTDLAEKTVINMEDYTFKYLKKPQDFIVRIISDFLPHETEIDFFEEVKSIDFLEGVKAVDGV